jgi:tRNA(fMet)-specific endonuclease VapC
MKYLLDTCTISDFIKGFPQVLARIKFLMPADLAVSSITRMEVEYGLQLNPQRGKIIEPLVNSLFASINTLDFGHAEAKTAGAIRAALRRQGKPIGAYDVLIAATALVHGLVLVTSNTKEFIRVNGLHLEDWRE